jgi:hypothetical protein
MAGSVGAGVIEKYGWKVDLKNFNMEVYAGEIVKRELVLIFRLEWR